MAYFARMLSKIRLHGAGELEPEYHRNLGRGGDGFCCDFLRVSYEELKARVLAGGTDEEILEWCFEHGRRLDRGDLRVWNGFITRFGWRDSATPFLEKFKAEAGLGDRADLVTMPDYFDVDEGRKP
jgi:gluconokinase